MSTCSLTASLALEDAHVRRARRIDAFHPSARSGIARLTRIIEAAEDLADSFPALLFALATGYGTHARRTRTIALVKRGASLREAAEALGLPWWLRRLPPSAFSEPLGEVPSDPEFAQRVGMYLPQEPTSSRTWLWAVLYGYRACDASFALWVAGWASKHPRLLAKPVGEDNLRWLAAWAWFSGQPGTDGFRLLRRGWVETMSVRRALEELSVWRRRLSLHATLVAAPTEPWLEEGHALGYDFVLLRSAFDFVREAETMDNCLDQFADRLEQDGSQVFSIRKQQKSVADVEMGPHHAEAGMPTIRQLRGPRNRRAAPEIWQAAYAWLGGQAVRPQPVPFRIDPAKARLAALELWQPYLDMLAERAGEHGFRALVLSDTGRLTGDAELETLRTLRRRR